MKLTYSALDTTKAGSSRADMEDAVLPAGRAAVDSDAGFRCAIADGATQGSHSGPWARFLCEAYLASPGGDAATTLSALVGEAQARFAAWEKTYVSGRQDQGRPLAWFEEAVISSGAYSTLVGLAVTPAAAGAHFEALAIGDSCLFVARDGQLRQSFPLTGSDQFAGAPFLLASLRERSGGMLGGLKVAAGDLAPGDRLYLCTDALAAWVLRQHEGGAPPFARLAQLADDGDPAAFEAFIAELRQGRLIRNDDTTLVQLVVEA